MVVAASVRDDETATRPAVRRRDEQSGRGATWPPLGRYPRMSQNHANEEPPPSRKRVIKLYAEVCGCENAHCIKHAVIADALHRAAAEQDRCVEVAYAEASRCPARRDGAGRAAAERIRDAIGAGALRRLPWLIQVRGGAP
jgi:hypothetical protein